MFLSIGLSAELMIWHCGDLLLSMLLGSTIVCQAGHLVLLHWNLVGNVGDISATFRPDTPRSHNLGDIWNVADNVTGPLW